ncbi:hypothetical protein ACFE04_006661 [Oxalis oulophora]
MFKPVNDIKDIKFSIGLAFINKVLAVDAIKDYEVAGGYNIRFKKNDSKRVRAKCVEGCKWEILISKEVVGETHDSRANERLQYGKCEGTQLGFQTLGCRTSFMCTTPICKLQGGFPSEELRLLMWYASKAPNIGRWKRVMEDIKDVNVKSYERLMALDPKLCCIHAFGPRAKCDTIVNNLSETFNSVILPVRELLKHASMFEWIISYRINRIREHERSMRGFT